MKNRTIDTIDKIRLRIKSVWYPAEAIAFLDKLYMDNQEIICQTDDVILKNNLLNDNMLIAAVRQHLTAEMK